MKARCNLYYGGLTLFGERDEVPSFRDWGGAPPSGRVIGGEASYTFNLTGWGLRRFFELAVVEIGVEAALRQKLFMAAALDDVAVTHDEYNVGVSDCGQPVRDDKRRPAFH